MICITWSSYACFFFGVFFHINLYLFFSRLVCDFYHKIIFVESLCLNTFEDQCFNPDLLSLVSFRSSRVASVMDSVICLAFHIQSLTQSDWLSFFLHNIHVLVQDSLFIFNKILKKEIWNLLRIIWMWFIFFKWPFSNVFQKS